MRSRAGIDTCPAVDTTRTSVRQTKKDTMLKRTKLLLVALIAVFAASVTAGSASASRAIEVRGGPRVSASSRLQFIGTERSAALEITCDITLLRTVGTSIAKTAGTVFGSVTGVAINRGGTTRSPACRHGSFVREVHDIVPLPATHRELGGNVLLYTLTTPWQLIYDSFQGTLPTIEGINFHIGRTAFNLVLLEPFGGTIECLYEGSGFGLIEIVRETGVITRARAVTERTGLTRIRGSGICPARGTFVGSFAVTPSLTIRLV